MYSYTDLHKVLFAYILLLRESLKKKKNIWKTSKGCLRAASAMTDKCVADAQRKVCLSPTAS
jgi:hypothetical protein